MRGWCGPRRPKSAVWSASLWTTLAKSCSSSSTLPAQTAAIRSNSKASPSPTNTWKRFPSLSCAVASHRCDAVPSVLPGRWLRPLLASASRWTRRRRSWTPKSASWQPKYISWKPSRVDPRVSGQSELLFIWETRKRHYLKRKGWFLYRAWAFNVEFSSRFLLLSQNVLVVPQRVSCHGPRRRLSSSDSMTSHMVTWSRVGLMNNPCSALVPAEDCNL